MNTVGIKQSKNFGNSLTNRRFGCANKKKFGPKLYKEDVISAHIAGQITIAEEIIKRHKNASYNTPDELIGDLHLIAKESFNLYALKYSSCRSKTISLEHFTEEG